MTDKEKQSWWDEPFPRPDIFISTVVIICVLGFLGMWFMLVMSWNDMPIDESPIFDIDGYLEHRGVFLTEIRGLSCETLAFNIASETYSNYGGKFYSDEYLAELEFGYECLGKERPVYTTTSFSAENPRSKQR